MPHGLIVMVWNEKYGVEIVAKYPSDITSRITEKTLLQIYNMHQFSRESGIAALTIEDVNFQSYYTGEPTGLYIVLVLNILENPEDYELRLSKVTLKILDNFVDEKYIELLPSLFKQISVKPPLNFTSDK